MVPPTTPAPAPAAPGRQRRRTAFHPLRVREVERLCEGAAAVTFDVPEELAEEFAFAPGQSLTLRRERDGRDERRSYSICSPAGGAPRIGVRVVPGGMFSTWLVDELRPGDTVEVMGPVGAFTPDLTRAGHHVLIAAGSGITPMLSIAGSVLAADADSQVTLLYGNRRSSSVMFADELADLKDLYPARFQIAHVLSREPREADILSGRLDTDRLTDLIHALIDMSEPQHWWLCGPHGMVRDAQQVLGHLGVPEERIHQELFYADDQEPAPVTREDGPALDGPASRITLVLDGRTTSFTQGRGESILDSAQRVRPDLPFACKGGVCGTCRARITDGEGDMRRNFALERSEVDEGYVLTCQTYPVSASVTVDYDS